MGKRWLTQITGIRVSNTWEGSDERWTDEEWRTEVLSKNKATRWMEKDEQWGYFNLFLACIPAFLLWTNLAFQLNCMYKTFLRFYFKKDLILLFCCSISSLLALLDSTLCWRGKKKTKKKSVAGFYSETPRRLYRKSQIFSENTQRCYRPWSHRWRAQTSFVLSDPEADWEVHRTTPSLCYTKARGKNAAACEKAPSFPCSTGCSSPITSIPAGRGSTSPPHTCVWVTEACWESDLWACAHW